MTPEPIDPTVERAVELLAPRAQLAEDPVTTEDVREQAEGLAASEEELVLIALFGDEAEALLRTIRARHTRDDRGETTLEESREQRIREIVRIVQESGVGEVEIDAGLLADRIDSIATLIVDETAPSRLRLNPADVARLAGMTLPLAAIADPNVTPGSILVETGSGWIEDGPAVRLEKLHGALDRLGAPK